jgi:hypothetical protein
MAPTLFCTYFDSNFVVRGLAMIRSLARHRSAPWRIVVLCLDEAVEGILTRMREQEPALAFVDLLPLARLEAEDPALPAVRASRSRVEYFFTCTPVLCRWLLASRPEVATLVYLDADLYFFANDQALFAEVERAPVAIIEHRFPEGFGYLAALYGRFNVGWVGFNRSPAAQTCLERWRAQCLEWCGGTAEGGRYGDQKYLDDWPERVPGLVVIKNPGADLGPWNLRRHSLQLGVNGVPRADNHPLIFYHFHGLEKWGGPGDYVAILNIRGGAPVIAVLGIYEPYIAELMSIEISIGAIAGDLLPTQVGRLVRKMEPSAGLPTLRRAAHEFLCKLRSRRVRFQAGRPDLLWRMLAWGKARV